MILSGQAGFVRWIGASLAGLLLLLAGSWPTAAAEERRVALVIGNGAYENATRLANPANDAKAMAEMLDRAGFEVLSGIDLTRVQMEDLIARFEAQVGGADATVAFFAGHGIQVDGRNYLFPVDARLEQRSDLRRLISADWLVEEAGRAGRLSLVILDACRDNPLARSFASRTRGAGVGRGLAQIQDQPTNTLIAYATAADAIAADGTGRNSPFTAALIEHLPTPGLEIGLALRKVRDAVIERTNGTQQPFTYGSLGGQEFYFAPSAVVAPPEVTKPAPPPAPAGQGDYGGKDLVAFEFIKDSTRERDFSDFLERFPNSAVAFLAQGRLDDLTRSTAELQPATEASPEQPTTSPDPDPPQALAALTPTAPAVASPPEPPPAERPLGAAEQEAALGLGRADWRNLQQGLKALGFEPGALTETPEPGRERR